MERVVAERIFEEPFRPEWIGENEGRIVPCLQTHEVRLLRSYLSPDRLRMICVYEAPDAESVRPANEKAGPPFDRAWTASIFGDG